MVVQRRRLLQALTAGVALGLAGCTGHAGGGDGRTPTGQALTLGTTTSTYDSGLVDRLVPPFEESFGVRVKTVVRGTGAILRLGRQGDVDVVLVHARDAEDRFVRDGFGVNRRDVMYNDFVVVGPPGDPAGVHDVDSPTAALRAIARAEATFLSRGDDSGTHVRERELWDRAGVDPGGQWYRETGQGQGETLVQADSEDAYALADRGTVVATRSELDLVVHVQGPMGGGPASLKNPYGVIAVNPARFPDANYALAMAFVGFLTGPRGQRVVDEYRIDDTRLFVPNALGETPDFEQYVPEDWRGG